MKVIIPESLGKQLFPENNINDNFKKWFDNSKTIRGAEPIVFLHGTKNKFNKFTIKRRGAFGIGYYFTTDYKEAKGYGSNILKVFLKLTNPATPKDVQDIMTSIPDVRYLEDYELAKITTQKLIEKGFDGLLFPYPDGNLLAMVINSEQIKSVQNDGTWDLTDDNIYS